VKLARFRRSKGICSPSYVDYRPKTNTAIIWDTGCTKGRLRMAWIGQGKETKTLNVLMYSLYRNEYRNLKLARGQGRNEEDW
jgi:hypothetical protein